MRERPDGGFDVGRTIVGGAIKPIPNSPRTDQVRPLGVDQERANQVSLIGVDLGAACHI